MRFRGPKALNDSLLGSSRGRLRYVITYPDLDFSLADARPDIPKSMFHNVRSSTKSEDRHKGRLGMTQAEMNGRPFPNLAAVRPTH